MQLHHLNIGSSTVAFIWWLGTKHELQSLILNLSFTLQLIGTLDQV